MVEPHGSDDLTETTVAVDVESSGAAVASKRRFNPIRSLKKLFGHHGKRVADQEDTVNAGLAEAECVTTHEQLTKSSSDLASDMQTEADGGDGQSSQLLPKEMSMSTDCIFPNQAMMLNTGHRSQLFGIGRMSDMKNTNVLSKLNNHISSRMVPLQSDFSAGNFSQSHRGPPAASVEHSSLAAAGSADTINGKTQTLQPIEDIEEDFFRSKWTSASHANAARQLSAVDGVDLGAVCRNSDNTVDNSNVVARHRLAVRPRGQRALSMYQPYLAGSRNYIRRHSIETALETNAVDSTEQRPTATEDHTAFKRSSASGLLETTAVKTPASASQPAVTFSRESTNSSANPPTHSESEPSAAIIETVPAASRSTVETESNSVITKPSKDQVNVTSIVHLPPTSGRDSSKRKNSAPRRRTIAAPNDAALMTAIALEKASASPNGMSETHKSPKLVSSHADAPCELALAFSKFRRFSESSDCIGNNLDSDYAAGPSNGNSAVATTSGALKIYTAAPPVVKMKAARSSEGLAAPPQVTTCRISASASMKLKPAKSSELLVAPPQDTTGRVSPSVPVRLKQAKSSEILTVPLPETAGRISPCAGPRIISERKKSSAGLESKSNPASLVTVDQTARKSSEVSQTSKKVDAIASSSDNPPKAVNGAEKPRGSVILRAGSISTNVSRLPLPHDTSERCEASKSPVTDMSPEAIALRRSRTAVAETRENKVGTAKDDRSETNSNTAKECDKSANSGNPSSSASGTISKSTGGGGSSSRVLGRASQSGHVPFSISRQKSCPLQGIADSTTPGFSENKKESGKSVGQQKMLDTCSDDATASKNATITIRKSRSIILKPMKNTTSENMALDPPQGCHSAYAGSNKPKRNSCETVEEKGRTVVVDADANATKSTSGKSSDVGTEKSVCGNVIVLKNLVVVGGCEASSKMEPSWLELARQKTQKWTEGKV